MFGRIVSSLLVAAVQSSHLQTHLPDILSLSLQRHHKIQEYRLASERPPALFLLGKVHSGQLEAQPGIFRCQFSDILGKMELAALPWSLRELPLQCSLNAAMSIGSDHQRPIKPPLLQPFQKIHPCSGGFFWIDVEAQDFSDTLTVCAIGNHKGLGDDPMIFPDLEVCRIHGQERIRSVQRTGPESFYVFVEVLTEV